jgi:hypothetical protein
MSSGLIASRKSTPQSANRTPSVPPASESRTLSTRNPRAIPSLPAPRTVRISTSRRGGAARVRQQERHRSEDHEERGPNLAHHLDLERVHADGRPFVRARVLDGERLRDGFHVGERPLERRAGLQSRHGEETGVTAPPLERRGGREGTEGDPGVDGRGLDRELEAGRHDTHDLVRVAVQRERPPYYVRGRAEAALPQPVADDDEVGSAGSVVLGRELPPESRRHAEGRKDGGGDEADRNALRSAFARHVRAVGPEDAHVLEGRVSGSPVEIIGIGEEHPLEVRDTRRVLPEDREPAGLVVGEGPEEHRVDGAEDGRRRSDAEREGEHDDRGEDGRLRELADADAYVLNQEFHGSLPEWWVPGG